jgi:hypothetical protein
MVLFLTNILLLRDMRKMHNIAMEDIESLTEQLVDDIDTYMFHLSDADWDRLSDIIKDRLEDYFDYPEYRHYN